MNMPDPKPCSLPAPECVHGWYDGNAPRGTLSPAEIANGHTLCAACRGADDALYEGSDW